MDQIRITVGGLTAGINLGFSVIEQRLGRDLVEAFLLSLECDPEPLSIGVPETARAQIVELVQANVAVRYADCLKAINASAAALKV